MVYVFQRIKRYYVTDINSYHSVFFVLFLFEINIDIIKISFFHYFYFIIICEVFYYKQISFLLQKKSWRFFLKFSRINKCSFYKERKFSKTWKIPIYLLIFHTILFLIYTIFCISPAFKGFYEFLRKISQLKKCLQI